MITRRIAPCLLISGRKLVKTVKFNEAKYIGDPINAVKIFNDKEVDEIVILDIEASASHRRPQFDYLAEIVSEAFVPICYGGGIQQLKDIDMLLSLGIEKVCVNSANANGFELITEAAKKYGSQSIVGVMDVKKSLFGKKNIHFKGKKLKHKIKLTDYALAMQNAGAGEILLNSVDRDGTFTGLDTELIAEISGLLKVPLVAVGGAGSTQDLKAAFEAGASAVSAGSLFVYHGPHKAVLINYPSRDQIEKIIF